MARTNTCRRTKPAAGRSPAAPNADAPGLPPANPGAASGRPFADPALLTPEERLAAFGRLFARAVQRRRARRAPKHCNNPSEQKRN
jgi:hypothetical protein